MPAHARVVIVGGGLVLADGLSNQGRIESEYTVTRLDDNHFYPLSAAAANLCNNDQLNHRKRDDERVTIKDITDDWGMLVLAGPRFMTRCGLPVKNSAKFETAIIKIRSILIV